MSIAGSTINVLLVFFCVLDVNVFVVKALTLCPCVFVCIFLQYTELYFTVKEENVRDILRYNSRKNIVEIDCELLLTTKKRCTT